MADWQAVAQRDDDAWEAKLQLVSGDSMVTYATCPHRHKTEAAALKCAKALGEAEGVLTL